MKFFILIYFLILTMLHKKVLSVGKTYLDDFEDSLSQFCQQSQYSLKSHSKKQPSDFSHVQKWCECMPSGLIMCEMNFRESPGFKIELNKTSFSGIHNRLKHLRIDLRYSDVDAYIKPNTFSLMENLTELEILGVNKLTQTPDLTTSTKLFKLVIKSSDIESLPLDFCYNKPHLTVVDFSHNKLKTVVNIFTECEKISHINLRHNFLTTAKNLFKEPSNELEHLDLGFNYLVKIGKYDLENLVNLKYLILNNNQIGYINENAFDKLSRLFHLDLSENRLRNLPGRSLAYASLGVLKIRGNKEMLYFPDERQFSSLRKFSAHYPYHCCYFHKRKIEKNEEEDEMEIIYDYFIPAKDMNFNETDEVECDPEPDPFSPCEDLLEDWWTRASVWFVSFIGIISNFLVVVYNLIHNIYYYHSNKEVDVPAYLLAHLATSDSLMSVYLMFIAVEDVKTRNEFSKTALVWQRSVPCNLAGFLSVSSSISSALLLSFITFERYYSIKNSIDYTKRVSLKTAFLVTLLIWSMSILSASLPLFDLNSYSTFAICLPLDTRYLIDQAYVISLSSLLVACFIIICIFYSLIFLNTIILERRASLSTCNNSDQIKMRNSEDQKLARNISLLVFVNIICWGPVVYLCIYSLVTTSVIDRYLMKIIAVFIIPFNSLINPFLYCISRRNFRVLLKAAFIKLSFKRSFGTFFSRNSAHSTVTVHTHI